MEERDKGWRSAASLLLPWLLWLLGSQQVPFGVEGWDNGMSWGKEVWRMSVCMMQGALLILAMLIFLFLTIVYLLLMLCVLLTSECIDSQSLLIYTLDTPPTFQKQENNF